MNAQEAYPVLDKLKLLHTITTSEEKEGNNKMILSLQEWSLILMQIAMHRYTSLLQHLKEEEFQLLLSKEYRFVL